MLELMEATAFASNEAAQLFDLSRFLVGVGDPIRQQILMLLSRERLNVGKLAERIHLSRPAVSHHLKLLMDAELLVQERVGRERVYRVDAARCRAFSDELRAFIETCAAGPACR
jgi:DNA-binding transcriptional ArsR family regulator